MKLSTESLKWRFWEEPSREVENQDISIKEDKRRNNFKERRNWNILEWVKVYLGGSVC